MFKHLILLAVACTGLATAEPPASPQPATAPSGPQLLELFTSQGCSSCPPAEDLFAGYATDEDLITIEWHVDYWDRLVHHGSNWKDPYSSSANTDRQRDYNEALRGTRSVYTPQAVYAGSAEYIGSHAHELAAARKKSAPTTAQLNVTGDTLNISGAGEGEIVFVRLLKEHKTNVKGGENKGRKLTGRNIALERVSLGNWNGEATSVDLPKREAGETCAVFIQSPNMGPVLGASYCGD